MAEYSLFHCVNNSNKFIIIFGGNPNKYVPFNTQREANDYYNKVSCIENSPFGSMNLLLPGEVHQRADWAGGDIATESLQDNAQRVNPDFLEKHLQRWDRKCFNEPADCSVAVRKYRLEKAFSSLFERLC